MSKRLLTLSVAALIGSIACAVEIPGTSQDDAISVDQSAEAPPRSPLADVVERVLPSVVNVRVNSIQCGAVGPVDQSAEGSGVVIDRRGVILTNFHVVQGAIEVEVVFNDDRDPLDGQVVGAVPERDLAIVRVAADDLRPIRIGRSSTLRLGDDVIAIGFPLGLGGPTVTKGILSAADRTIVTGGGGVGERLEGLLQTDAAINPGNSGGALIDASGKLVGINTAAAQAGAAENIGFAIAIDGALPVVEEILNEPPGDRAWLGVSVASVASSAEAVRIGLDADVRGAFVSEVFAGSPAAAAGVGRGDVITAIDGDAVGSADQLTEVLAGHDPGEVVTVVLVNTAGELTAEATLAERPEVVDAPDC